MRTAPVAIAYRNATDDVLHKAVVDAVICTHSHPVSVDAAYVHAKAITLLQKTDPTRFIPETFLGLLEFSARTDVIRDTIRKVVIQLQHYVGTPTDTSLSYTTGDHVIGNGVAAPDAVGSSLLMFTRFWKTPEDAVINAVSLGGDTDTVSHKCSYCCYLITDYHRLPHTQAH